MSRDPIVYYMTKREIREFLDCIIDSRVAMELYNFWKNDIFELSDGSVLAIFSEGIIIFDSVDDFHLNRKEGLDSNALELIQSLALRDES